MHLRELIGAHKSQGKIETINDRQEENREQLARI